ncbi:hypothetical protein [Streptomyces parvulus]|uniref:hypothetical protein n=1 Tax=Streptomyces parvulus TaxID=146923 RepID=UPI0033E90D4F
MPVPHIDLTESQRRLLAELVLSPLPVTSPEESAVARGITSHQLQGDASTLQWMGLIAESAGLLSVTAQGAAVIHRAEQEKAESRLAEVAAFADILEVPGGGHIDRHRIAFALRRLTQGDFSLDDAVGYLHTTD